MPSGTNPVDNPSKIIVSNRVMPNAETVNDEYVFSYNFTNQPLDEGMTCVPWVQALYENSDSQWASMGGQVIEDDGQATIVVIGNPTFQQIIDMADDSKITPQEKIQLQKEWQEVVAEHQQIEIGAIKADILNTSEVTNYVNAVHYLAKYLNYDVTYEFFEITSDNFRYPSMLTDKETTDLSTGHYGGKDKYNSVWREYYEARIDVLEKIRDQLFENNKAEIEGWIGETVLPSTIEVGGYISSRLTANMNYRNEEELGYIKVHFGTFITPTGMKFSIEGDKHIPTYLTSNENRAVYLIFVGADSSRFSFGSNNDSQQFIYATHNSKEWFYIHNGEEKSFKPNTEDCVVAKVEEYSTTDNRAGIKAIKLLSSNGDALFETLTDGGKSQGIYRDEETGLIFINAEYMKIGTIQSQNGRSVFDLNDGTFRLGGTKEENYKDFGLMFDGIDLWLGKGTIKWTNLDRESQENIQGVRLEIIGGIRSIRLSEAGKVINHPEQYEVRAYVGENDVTSKCVFSWETKGYFLGSGVGKTFTPTIRDASEDDDTCVTVSAVYNDRGFITTLPIPVSKDGSSGTARYVVVTGDQVFKYNLEVSDKPNPSYLKLKAELYNIDILGKWQYKDGDIWKDLTTSDCLAGVAITGQTIVGLKGRDEGANYVYKSTDAISGAGITGKAKTGLTDKPEDGKIPDDSVISDTTVTIFPFSGLFIDPDEDIMQVRYIVDGMSDSISLIKVYDGFDGTDSYNLSLTNEAHIIPCDAEGNPIPEALEEAYTEVFLYKGASIIQDATITAKATGCEVEVEGNKVQVLGMPADLATVNVTASCDSYTATKIMTLSKARNSVSKYIVISGEQSFTYGANNEPTNRSLELTAIIHNIEGRGQWQYKNSTGEWVALSGAYAKNTTNEATKNEDKIIIHPESGAFADSEVKSMLVRYVIGEIYGTTNIIKVYDGKNGTDGKDGKDANSVRIVGDQVFKYENGFDQLPTPTSIRLECVLTGDSEQSSSVKWEAKKPDGSIVLISQNENYLTVEHDASYWGEHKTITIVASVDDIKDEMTLIKLSDGIDGVDGESAYSIILSNEAHSFLATSDGTILENTTTSTKVTAYKGTEEIDVNIGALNPVPGLSITKEGSTINITALEGNDLPDAGELDITISVEGYRFVKTFTWTKTKQGQMGPPGIDGRSATAYWLVSSASAIGKNTSNIYNPSSVTFTGKHQTGDSSVDDYRCRLKIEESINGTDFSTKYISAADEASKTWTPSATNVKSIKVKMYQAGDTSVLLDEQVIPIVTDGVNGINGSNGTNGQNAQYVIVTGEQVFKYTNNFTGAATPNSITLTASKINTTLSGKWQYKNTSGTWIDWSSDGSVQTGTTLVVHPTSGTLSSAKQMSIRYILSNNIYDELTIVKVSDGADGQDGVDGIDGQNGADGINGQDAYTVILSNESHTFPAQNNGNISSAITTTTNVIAYKGSSSITPIIGTLPTVNGLTLSKSGSTITIQANTGTSLADFGSFNIPVTVDGKSFTKSFSWSKAKQGNAGANGTNGTNGADGADGAPAVTAVLSNDSHNIPCNSSGTPTTYAGAVTTMSVFVGSSDTSSSWTYKATPTNVTGTLSNNNRTFTVTGISADTGYVDITASRSGYSSVTKRFTLTKSKQGATGPQGPQGPAGNNGQDANMLDWVKEWDSNKTEVNGTSMLTPKLFAGKVSNSLATGIALGKRALGNTDNDTHIGLGVWNNGQLNMKIETTGKVTIGRNIGSQFIVNTDGSIVTPNISANTITSGTLQVGGNVNGNGSIVIKDASNNDITTMNKNGITINDSYYLIKDKYGIINNTQLSSNFIKDPMMRLTNKYEFREQFFGACVNPLDTKQDSWKFYSLAVSSPTSYNLEVGNGLPGGKLMDRHEAMDLGYCPRPGNFEAYCAIGDTAYIGDYQRCLGSTISLAQTQSSFTLSLFASCFSSSDMSQTGDCTLTVKVYPKVLIGTRNAEQKGALSYQWDTSCSVTKSVTLTSYNKMNRYTFTFNKSEFNSFNGIGLSGDFLVIFGSNSSKYIVMNGFQLKPGNYPNVFSEDTNETHKLASTIIGEMNNVSNIKYDMFLGDYLEGGFDLDCYGLQVKGLGQVSGSSTACNKMIYGSSEATFTPYSTSTKFNFKGNYNFENALSINGVTFSKTGITVSSNGYKINMGTKAYVGTSSSGDFEISSSNPTTNVYWTHIKDVHLKLGQSGGRIDTTGGAFRLYRSSSDYGIRINSDCVTMLEVGNTFLGFDGSLFRVSGVTSFWSPYQSNIQGCGIRGTNGLMVIENSTANFHFLTNSGSPTSIYAKNLIQKATLSVNELTTAANSIKSSALDTLSNFETIKHKGNELLIPKSIDLSEDNLSASNDYINMQMSDDNIIITQDQSSIISILVKAVNELRVENETLKKDFERLKASIV